MTPNEPHRSWSRFGSDSQRRRPNPDATRLTFLSASGQMIDGHERSMAGTRCASGCHSGDGWGS
jgi:hypothetical protein